MAGSPPLNWSLQYPHHHLLSPHGNTLLHPVQKYSYIEASLFERKYDSHSSLHSSLHSCWMHSTHFEKVVRQIVTSHCKIVEAASENIGTSQPSLGNKEMCNFVHLYQPTYIHIKLICVPETIKKDNVDLLQNLKARKFVLVLCITIILHASTITHTIRHLYFLSLIQLYRPLPQVYQQMWVPQHLLEYIQQDTRAGIKQWVIKNCG